MIATLTPKRQLQAALARNLRRFRPCFPLFTLLFLFPALAAAQSPFDTGFTAMQTLFTGTIAKVASLIAIVVGGYQFAHGEPGAKKLAHRVPVQVVWLLQCAALTRCGGLRSGTTLVCEANRCRSISAQCSIPENTVASSPHAAPG